MWEFTTGAVVAVIDACGKTTFAFGASDTSVLTCLSLVYSLRAVGAALVAVRAALRMIGRKVYGGPNIQNEGSLTKCTHDTKHRRTDKKIRGYDT